MTWLSSPQHRLTVPVNQWRCASCHLFYDIGWFGSLKTEPREQNRKWFVWSPCFGFANTATLATSPTLIGDAWSVTTGTQVVTRVIWGLCHNCEKVPILRQPYYQYLMEPNCLWKWMRCLAFFFYVEYFRKHLLKHKGQPLCSIKFPTLFSATPPLVLSSPIKWAIPSLVLYHELRRREIKMGKIWLSVGKTQLNLYFFSH